MENDKFFINRKAYHKPEPLVIPDEIRTMYRKKHPLQKDWWTFRKTLWTIMLSITPVVVMFQSISWSKDKVMKTMDCHIVEVSLKSSDIDRHIRKLSREEYDKSSTNIYQATLETRYMLEEVLSEKAKERALKRLHNDSLKWNLK